MSKTVILHHASCPDGFGAAWWLQRCLGVECELIPMQWHERPPLERMEGAQVWSVDYCLDEEWLLAVDLTVQNHTTLDHHQSSMSQVGALQFFDKISDFCDVAELGGLNRTSIVIDQTHSGVGLVAHAMKRATGKVSPLFIQNIEDRDLWLFFLPDTKDVTSAINARPYTIEAWDALLATDHAQLVAEGQAINLYRNQMIEAVAASTFGIRIWNQHVWCASSPYMIGSDVAGLIAERSPAGIGAYCILHDDHVQIGLRSRGDGPDVAKIAEAHGGGGHGNASGLRMDWDEFHSRTMAPGVPQSALTEI